MASAEEPLMSSEVDGDENETVVNGLDDVISNADGSDGPPGAFVWLLTVSAGISGLLFGCKGSLLNLFDAPTDIL
jgi:hypothetical protein